MTEIARLAGVSKNTVSLALRHDRRIPEATRRRILCIAEKIGYRKNAIVARLMTELRKSETPRFKSCLALVNANSAKHAFRHHPTIPTYVEGCQRRAQALGYRLDEFWLHDPALDGDRLNRILRARGISGVIVVGLMRENRLPDRFLPTWREFPTVVTGVRTHEPALSFVSADHHMLTLGAFQKALQLGYKRPALVIDPVIDQLVERRFSAGVYIAWKNLPASRRVRIFDLEDDSPGNRERFREWLRKEKPDVLLTLYNIIRHWLEEDGWRIPQDIGLIQLEWRAKYPGWAGMNQHNDVVGEAAVDMVVGMIHHHEIGIPEFPRATLIGSNWVDGKTVSSLVS